MTSEIGSQESAPHPEAIEGSQLPEHEPVSSYGLETSSR